MKEMLNNLKQLADSLLSSLKLHYEIANKLDINRKELVIYEEVTSIVENIIKKVSSVGKNQTTIAINYLRQFYQHFNNFYNNLPYRNREQTIIGQINKNIEIDKHKKIIKNSLNNLRSQFEQLKFNLDFFIKLDFFSNNIVVIGANGSGKTSLANILRRYLGNNGIVISAQRILRIPNFNSIPNPSQTLNQLKQSQTQDKTAKSEQSYSILHNEFIIVLQHLLADNIAKEHEYVERARKYGTKGDKIPEPPLTNLEKTFQIWKELIGHRSIRTKDGINIVVETPEGETYPAIQMSDGEKVVLYLVAQILQAPENGFIVIDEPEMHLHKAILYKLWDVLEKEREDCIFIYLTHDLDFAVSRTTAKKVWIKSYTPPDKFEIEDVPSNEIPENLMMELLGSRKTILFCEGKRGSIDEKIYKILFPNFTIIPVEGCTSVINYTKAYNKVPNTYSKAIGIIDRDFRSQEEIEDLKQNNIFVLDFAEIENLFLLEDFLELVGEKWDVSNTKQSIDNIKEKIIEELKKQKEMQISRYVTAKLNFYFSNSSIEKANNIAEVKERYKKFISQVDIDKWCREREEHINRIILKKDYLEAIKIFNNKGLKQKVNEEFKIKDFLERAINFLNTSDEAKDILHSVFPKEVLNEHNC